VRALELNAPKYYATKTNATAWKYCVYLVDVNGDGKPDVTENLEQEQRAAQQGE